MHIVHYNVKYGNLKAAAKQNGDGLAILAFMFDVRQNLHLCAVRLNENYLHFYISKQLLKLKLNSGNYFGI